MITHTRTLRLTKQSDDTWHGGGINASNVFSAHNTEELKKRSNNHRSVWICVWGDCRDASWKAPAVLKMFSFHAKTRSWCFQIPEVWRALTQSSVLWRISVDGRPGRRSKAAFSNSSVRRSVNETLGRTLFLRERNRTCLRRKQDDEKWHNFYNPNGNRRWYVKPVQKHDRMRRNTIK